MSAPARAAHVVMTPRVGFWSATCLHCGAELAIALPQSLRVTLAASNAFVAEHAGCPKPAYGGQL